MMNSLREQVGEHQDAEADEDDDLEGVLKEAFEVEDFVNSTRQPLRKFAVLLEYGTSSEYLQRFDNLVHHVEKECALFLSSIDKLSQVNLDNQSIEDGLAEHWKNTIEPSKVAGQIAQALPKIRRVAAMLERFEQDLLEADWKFDPDKKHFKCAKGANNRPNLLFNEIVRDLLISWRAEKKKAGDVESLSKLNSLAFRKHAARRLQGIFPPELLDTAYDGAIALAIDSLSPRK